MCGIAGICVFGGKAKMYESSLDDSLNRLSKRGPDTNGTFYHNQVGLAHARLSIIDVSQAAVQPMSDSSGRYTIIFNGEIYNYLALRQELLDQGVSFRTSSDTEVLLQLYIRYGVDCLEKLNGFFAFAIYDKEEEELLIARDRLGIKPLLYYADDEKLVFASEMKAILAFPFDRTIDSVALAMYLQLNYIPAPSTIFKKVHKLMPGEYMLVKKNLQPAIENYYTIPYQVGVELKEAISYENAQVELRKLLDGAVKKRLVADVPLGAFLSGGIDSSVIVGLASQYKKLDTFSIGFADEPFFDETHYANLVARKFNTNHTVFSLTNDDLYEHLFDILDYIDEPFADSSAIPVFILSKHTRKHSTVALSGDGADELFAGYNKHLAEYKARQDTWVNAVLKWSSPLLGIMPQSRQTKVGNLFRQLNRFSKGVGLSNADRYWRWCSFVDESEAIGMLDIALDESELQQRKNFYTSCIPEEGTVNDNLFADTRLVLPNDMLAKVDLMSMANSLEVRVPFLDHEVVNFLFSLPSDYKIYKGFRKRLLKDAYREMLPAELYNRPKQGFEVPLLGWFKGELKGLIEDDLLSERLIEEQGIFNFEAINAMKRQLFSNNPGEIHARIWGIVVFQYWWKKYLS